MALLFAIDWKFLHDALAALKDEFVPLAADMVDAGRAIAGTAAVFYIAYRVWGHIARAEPVDFYPLFRPFVLGFILTMYTSFVGFIDSMCQPVIAATENMVSAQQSDVDKFRKMRHQMDSIAIERKKQVLADASIWRDKDISVQDPGGQSTTINTNAFKASGDLLYTQMQVSIRELIYNIVDFLYQAASLCIDTIRTFFMVLLIIVGPISIGVSVFDGFKDNLTKWIDRYATVVLWAACANIFTAILSKVQVMMLQRALSEMAANGEEVAFSSSDMVYIIFMLIGVVGYATVPALAGYIVESGGIGAMGRAGLGGFATGAAAGSGGTMLAAQAAGGATGILSAPYAAMQGYNAAANANSAASRIAAGGSADANHANPAGTNAGMRPTTFAGMAGRMAGSAQHGNAFTSGTPPATSGGPSDRVYKGGGGGTSAGPPSGNANSS